MDSLMLIENLEDIIEKAIVIPITGKCLVDKEELLDIIKQVRLKLPDDLKQAKWIKDERQRILSEAQREAAQTIKEAEEKVISMIDDHEITKKSYEKANELEALSKKRSRELKDATNSYIEGKLSEVEKMVENTLDEIRNNREVIRHRNNNQ
ncbi:MAG: ATPase [Eubacteriales bacterium]|nr:ATPase [Eubacteriales bacterium]